MLIMGWDRQQRQQIAVVMNDLLAGRILDFHPGKRFGNGVLENLKQRRAIKSERFGHPVSIRQQSRDHGDIAVTGRGKQRRFAAVEPICDAAKLMLQLDAGFHDREPTRCLEMREPGAQSHIPAL